jgi:hypothetical protein
MEKLSKRVQLRSVSREDLEQVHGGGQVMYPSTIITDKDVYTDWSSDRSIE